MPSQCFDVLIVGGGLVGASLACALDGSGLRVGMVEAVPFSAPDQPSYDERTLALSWGSRCPFDALGLWPAFADEATPIRRLHVSERGRFGVTRVSHADYGVDALGYVIPNRVLGRGLYARLDGVKNVELFSPARFVKLESGEDTTAVTIVDGADNKRLLQTRLLVGADGARSRVRDALNITALTRDYQQQAIVTTVTPGRPHNGTAYERFTPDGPLALLPRGADSCAVVWSLAAQRAEQLLACEAFDFVAQLQAAFGQRLGTLSQPGKRLSYPLIRLVCRKPVAQRALLIGNAGHNLHPAAAQGFNLALRDAMTLAELLHATAAAGGDPGAAELLSRWHGARRADQRRVADFTDRIVRVFSNHVPGLGIARGLGLLGLELVPTIKHDMARRSLGLSMTQLNTGTH